MHIELDEVSPPAPRQTRSRSRRRPHAAILLLLLVFAPAMDARPPQLLIPQATLTVDEGATPLGIVAGKLIIESSRRIAGFDMASGERIWEVSRENAPLSAQLLPESNLVLVTILFPLSSHSDSSASEATTIAVDAATGARRWTNPGWIHIVGDVVVVVRADQGTSVAIHDLATFAPRWKAPAGLESWAVDAQRHTLLMLSDKGTLTEFQLADGAQVRTGRVTAPQYSTLDVLPGRIRMTADEEEIWLDRESFLPATPVELASPDQPCGSLVCRAGYSHLYFVDAKSGNVVRTLEDHSVFSTAAGLVLTVPNGQEAGISPAVELADSATGVTESSLKDWWVTISPRGEASPVLFQPSPEHTHLALLSKDGFVPLGAVNGMAARCLYQAPLIACRTTPEGMGVWRVNDRAG